MSIERYIFWGFSSKNIREIAECEEKKEEWYYVDIGYITDDIVRYPVPEITKPDTTYFRIVKVSIYNQR